MIVLISFLSVITSALEIIGPDTLAKNFTSKIDFSLGNFGKVPYGKQLLGDIILSDPLDACLPIITHNSTQKPFFLLAMRGNCTFISKANYAQLVGAKMLIIVDSLEENVNDIQMTVERGNTYNIEIPSVIISKKQGLQLIDYLKPTSIPSQKKNDDVKDNDNDIPTENKKEQPKFEYKVAQGKISFQHQAQQMKISLYNKLDDPLSMRLFKIIQNYEKKVDKLPFQPIYYMWECQYCSQSIKDELCFGNGRYCLDRIINYDESGTVPESIKQNPQNTFFMETLRQLCVFQQSNELYFQYMNQYAKNCFNTTQLHNCSNLIQKDIKVNSDEIHNCLSKSYQTSDFNKLSTNELKSDKNLLLDQNMKAIADQQINVWPAISLGKDYFRGDFQYETISEWLCSAYKSNAPEFCDKLNENIKQSQNGNSGWKTFFFLMFIIILITLGMLFYQRYIKKDLKQEMKQQVDQAVSQYMAFYEQRAKLNV